MSAAARLVVLLLLSQAGGKDSEWVNRSCSICGGGDIIMQTLPLKTFSVC